MLDFLALRHAMVDQQVAQRQVLDGRVLDAMRRVPREEFVSEEFQKWAYADRPLPIELGQTISQPYVVALMAQALQLKEGAQRVLEVGTGSGYGAAVLSLLAQEVYTIERHPLLAEQAKERFRKLGYRNISVEVRDGSKGLPELAPFDGICVTAAAQQMPEDLVSQLKVGARLVVPIGPQYEVQSLSVIIRKTESQFLQEDLGAVQFVPLVSD